MSQQLIGARGRFAAAAISWAAACALAVALAGCAPSGQPEKVQADAGAEKVAVAQESGAEEKAGTDTAVSATTAMADFTQRSTGLFPDIQENGKYLNSGSRGCNSCHSDLFDLNKDNGTTAHITNFVGLKSANYMGDCATCHNGMTGTAGNILSESIHTLHYSSTMFNEGNGNCWSCHVTTVDEDGDMVLKLYEQVMYEAVWGGYPDNATEFTQDWCEQRGWTSGFMSGASIDTAPSVEVTLDQMVSEEDDQFYIQNFKHLDGNDAYATIDPATYKMKVTGAEKSDEYSLDDLKAMPQTEMTATQWCLVVGYNTAMVNNTPFKGVLLKDFVEAVGVPADANTVTVHAIDGWTGVMPGGAGDLQAYIDAGAMLVYNSWGHDLKIEQGAPVVLFIPGTGGTVSIKYVDGLDFSTTENPDKIDVICPQFPNDQMVLDINSSWFDNDGVRAKVGQPVELQGATYGWSIGAMEYGVDRVEFSFDFGNNWIGYDVPADFDDDQWSHYTMTWTPKEAGTYVLKVRGVAHDGTVQATPSSVIVIVEE